MQNFPHQFRALVIGSSGAMGAALVAALEQQARCSTVIGLHRHSTPRIDFADETTIAEAAATLSSTARFHLIINATGILHQAGMMPEKRLADLNYAHLQTIFQVNTLGPALVLRHFAPLLDPERGVMALLSAKVGSIGDNRLGGWYGYRASKAALNMLVKTAAIELARSNKQSVLVALHPGTVNSALSRPFRGEQIGRPAADVAADLLQVIDGLTAADSGSFRSYKGEILPW
ncbi:SDR family oxidoreductase [Duganella qianjiadongensis]|nr:SDR family oxidoreductase [Duganella qianjiadongensis]